MSDSLEMVSQRGSGVSLVSVAEKVFIIPAEAGIQLFRSGSLRSQG
jgi:hypothetical protein